MSKKVSVLVGSLRKASIARKIAKNLIEMFPEGYDVNIIEIRDLPLYDNDYDNADVTDKPLPEIYKEFRETIKASDGILFVTPENNRVVPACLKNAVDICSKPNGDVAMKGKPGAIVSHSVGTMGGYSSQKTLKLATSYFDMKYPGQPEIFLAKSPQYFDEGSDKINSQRTIDFLQNYINTFVKLIEE